MKSLTMSPVLPLLLLLWLSETASLSPQISQKDKSKGLYSSPKILENPNLFSPRMDYDEWTPLGRGDPLKNDPTYDYVPPVLERVHYWMDPSKRTPDPPLPNSGLLVLGSRTESTFTTRPSTPRYQTFQSKEPQQADSRIDTSSLLDPFFKLMDMSQFNLNFNPTANNHYKPVPNRVQRPHHHQSNKQRTQPPQALQRPPYTMLMPPPPPPPPISHTNFQATIQTRSPLTTAPPTSGSPLTTRNATTTASTSVIANTENLFKQVAISMPENVDIVENETQNEIKATISSKKPVVKPTIKPTTKPTTEDTSMVLPIVTMFSNQKKHLSNISKPQQPLNSPQTYPTTTKPKPAKFTTLPPEIYNNNINTPSETMTPPPKDTSFPTMTQQPWTRESETRFSTVRATTMAPPTTTTVTTKINTLTTDPMFKHYKQPSEPIKGPFYLIIQGHSKVKTYGANKNPINRLLTSNEIKYDDDDVKRKNQKFERKSRRLSYDPLNQDTLDGYNNVEDVENQEEVSYVLTGEDNLESLEETFPKSSGGSSKKRYLGSESRKKRNTVSRRLLSVIPENNLEDCLTNERNSTVLEGKSDNLDLESLIAVNDDYDPVDVANILLKEEGSPGSGFGNFAVSILGTSEEEEEV